ncbi:unnamed protein product [Rhizophagus irregularis]|uniref:Uncharacterized protein n=1 Tax=Rhizophagus irregularis TaxID=588596 RepID=A0A916DZI4_9GLOM|nr:unnamed protein product [Rhizophagus irregularis]
MASFFEAEVYFASVSKWIDNLKIVPIGGITSHMTYGQTDLDNLFLRVLRKFFLFYFRFLDASWNIDSKVIRSKICDRLFFWLPFTIGFLLGFFQLSALDIWISDFVRHWILNTEFLLQYLAAHVISALHLGVRFLSRSGTIQLGNFLEWIFLER